MSRPARIAVEERDRLRIVEISGEIDLSNAAEVKQQAIDNLASTTGAVVLDLTRVSYLDSSGVGLIFETDVRLARRGVALVLVVPPRSPIKRTLEVTQLDAAVAVEATIDAAIARARGDGDPTA